MDEIERKQNIIYLLKTQKHVRNARALSNFYFLNEHFKPHFNTVFHVVSKNKLFICSKTRLSTSLAWKSKLLTYFFFLFLFLFLGSLDRIIF